MAVPNLFSRFRYSVSSPSALSSLPGAQEGSDCWVVSTKSFWIYTSGAWVNSQTLFTTNGILAVPFTGALGNFSLSVSYQIINKLVTLDFPGSPTSNTTVATAGTINATIPTVPTPAINRAYECATKNGVLSLVAYIPSNTTLSTTGVLNVSNGMLSATAGLTNFAVSSLTNGSGFLPFSINYLSG